MNASKKLILSLSLFCVASLQAQSIFKKPPQVDWSKINTDNIEFPQDFDWGVACSHFQSDGRTTFDKDGNEALCNNNWTKDYTVFRGGKPFVIEGNAKDNHIACGHWDLEQFAQDIQLLKRMGAKSYRSTFFGWEKVEPGKQGEYNQHVLKHGIKRLKMVVEAGIDPWVCFFHHTWPEEFDKNGGFEKEENIKQFVNYVEAVVKECKDNNLFIKRWMPFNEPVAYAMAAYTAGMYPPYKKNMKLAGVVVKNMLYAHVEAAKVIKKYYPDAQVGMAKVMRPFHASRRWHPVELILTKLMDRLMNDVALEFFATGTFKWLPFTGSSYNKDAKDSLDFLGVNYYSGTIFSFHSYNNDKWVRTDKILPGRGFKKNEHSDELVSNYPEGLYLMLKKASQKLPKVPLMIGEFGVSTPDEDFRKEFLKQHVYIMYKAIENGIKLTGAHIWTWLDSYGWHGEAKSRFGLCHTDFDTLKRTLRESVKDYIHLMKNGRYPSVHEKIYKGTRKPKMNLDMTKEKLLKHSMNLDRKFP